jgi:hypothetical protein
MKCRPGERAAGVAFVLSPVGRHASALTMSCTVESRMASSAHGLAIGARRPPLSYDPIATADQAAEAAGLARASMSASAVTSAAWMQSGIPTPSYAMPAR